MAQDQQIEGLPAGATLKPIEGLPPGADLRPIGQQPSVVGLPDGQSLPSAPGIARPDLHRVASPVTALREFGKGAVQTIPNMISHPRQTIESAIQPSIASGMSPMGEGYPIFSAGRKEDMASNAEMQRSAQEGQRQQAASIKENPAYAAGGLASIAGVGAALHSAPRIGAGVADAIHPTSSPEIVPPIEAHAENLAKAILPPEGITPNLLKSIQREGPTIREYANRTNNPLNTQSEGLKAAQGVGEEGVQHFNQHFLNPNKDVQVQLPSGTSKELGHVATIEQINKRISDINDLQRKISNTAKSGGAAATAQEMQGLENEGKALRSKLYETLSEKSGVSPEDIKEMREGYGGQYTVANALESARMGRLGRSGASSQGTGGAMPLTKPGIVDSLWRGIRGGEENIANRQFRARIGKFEPQPPKRPIPFAQSEEQEEFPAILRQNNFGQGIRREPTPPIEMQGPLSKVTDVPALREAHEASQSLRNAGNAEYARGKALQASEARARKLVEQQRLAKAREQQTQSRVLRDYR